MKTGVDSCDLSLAEEDCQQLYIFQQAEGIISKILCLEKLCQEKFLDALIVQKGIGKKCIHVDVNFKIFF